MPYYITTPIYYPNSSPHIGTAYTTVAADAIARLQRMRGLEVRFLTGTDENSQKIIRAAESAGLEPMPYVDGIVEKFRGLWRLLEVQHDDFIRTTEKRHADAVQLIFRQLFDQGDIYKAEYEGWYCTPCETFWPEKKVADGKCPNDWCRHEVEWMKEESYFFRLSKYQDRLLAHIEAHPEFIQPVSRRNEMIRFITGGLEDLCVSRTTFKWGITVPFDPKHVVYVWLDALINYISALGYPDGELFRKFWPADVHIMGKDIVRFHAVIWPIVLLALGVPLPGQIYGHGWFVDREGGKISKSRGNAQDSFALLERYGSDAVRYFLLREMQSGGDGTYSEDDLVARINVDLANDLGNFVSRALAMIERYCGGAVPAPGPPGEREKEIAALAGEVWRGVERKLLACDPAGALEELWRLVARMNKYVDESAPWALAKDEDPAAAQRLRTVLYTCAEAIRVLGVLCAPFMPGVPERLRPLLGGGVSFSDWADGGVWGLLAAGTPVQKGAPLFPRIDLSQFEEEAGAGETEAAAGAGEAAAAGTATAETGTGTGTATAGTATETTETTETKGEVKTTDRPVKDEITMEDFAKIDLRVVRVLQAERIPKTDKLLRLEVDLGGETRVVVSGIAARYAPEDLVGKKLVLVANLQPAKLRGVVSQGMILAAAAGEKLEVIFADEAEPGTEVR
ncbi:MAG: methionine--tRNA ligase [Gracilibacteraceae bacterium]|jgi:methionyl-tRNA synthetase|nr:methionine--tRNA ligase [Gracilibacteraceae bacterium]